MKTKTLVAAILVLALLFGGAAAVFNQGGSANQPGGNPADQFTGRILSPQLSPQKFTNVSVLSDQGCTTDPRTGLSNCTSSMSTPSGIIYFNYEHNMMQKPCLSQGDLADVYVNADGSAAVVRTYWSGKGGA